MAAVPHFKGDWLASASYVEHDIVNYIDNGGAYNGVFAAITTVPAGTLISDSNYWRPIYNFPTVTILDSNYSASLVSTTCGRRATVTGSITVAADTTGSHQYILSGLPKSRVNIRFAVNVGTASSPIFRSFTIDVNGRLSVYFGTNTIAAGTAIYFSVSYITGV